MSSGFTNGVLPKSSEQCPPSPHCRRGRGINNQHGLVSQNSRVPDHKWLLAFHPRPARGSSAVKCRIKTHLAIMIQAGATTRAAMQVHKHLSCWTAHSLDPHWSRLIRLILHLPDCSSSASETFEASLGTGREPAHWHRHRHGSAAAAWPPSATCSRPRPRPSRQPWPSTLPSQVMVIEDLFLKGYCQKQTCANAFDA